MPLSGASVSVIFGVIGASCSGDAQTVLTLLTKDCSDGGVAMVEDAVDGATDEEGSCDCAEWAEGEFVLNVIVHLGASGHVSELVAVMPLAIRAGELDVGEG